jgi:hypothetical protein
MWALEGLDRLVRNGRFTVPGASADAANLMMDLASPMSAFVRDRCVRDVNAIVERDVSITRGRTGPRRAATWLEQSPPSGGTYARWCPS